MSEKKTKTKRGRPAKISRDDIISASLRAKTELTLKSLAEDLNVTPQALYRYVNGLGEIMEMVTEKLAGEYPFPGDDGRDWFGWIYESAHVLRRFYLAIPGLADYAMNAPWRMAAILSRYELALSIARRSGFDEATGYWATRSVVELVYSSVAQEQRRAVSEASERGELGLLIERVEKSEEKLPFLERALLNARKASADERFDTTLRWLLTGIAQENGMRIALPRSGSLALKLPKIGRGKAVSAKKR